MSSPIVYESFTEVVDHDYDPVEDHDDADDLSFRISRVAQLAAPFGRFRVLSSSVTTPSIVVPYVQVGEGAHDSDAVYGIKRAFARSVSGFRLRALMNKPLEVRRSWGPRFSDEFGQKQYTRARHTLLAPYFDAFAISLMHPSAPEMSPRDKQIQTQIVVRRSRPVSLATMDRPQLASAIFTHGSPSQDSSPL